MNTPIYEQETIITFCRDRTRINLTALGKIGKYLKWGEKDYATVMEIVKGG